MEALLAVAFLPWFGWVVYWIADLNARLEVLKLRIEVLEKDAE